MQRTAPALQSASHKFAQIIAWFNHLPPAWHSSLVVFVTGRLLFSIWGVVIWIMGFRMPQDTYLYFEVTPILDGIPGMLVGMWQRWDTIHYLRIAMLGYTSEDLTAFYPLFPLLGRWLSGLTGLDLTVTLLLISNLCFYLSLVLLYQIVAEHFNQRMARGALLALLLWPFSFYNYAAYPQSMLLLLILGAYWLARKQHWAGAAALNLLAGLTHSTAALLTILLVYPVWQAVKQEKPRFSARLSVLLVPFTNFLGIALFLAWRQAAGWPSYPDTLQRMFHRSMDLPWNAVITYATYIFNMPLEVSNLIPWIGVFFFLITVALTVWGLRFTPKDWWVYQAILLIFLMCNKIEGAPMIAFLRYCLVMFPLFFQLAWLSKKRTWKNAILVIGMIASLLLSAMFFMWRGDVI